MSQARNPKAWGRQGQRRRTAAQPHEANQTIAAIESLFAETVSLFHRLRAAAEQIHHQGFLTAGRRGILMGLDRFGPQAVPQMARARPVSRQHIQSLVNPLAKEGYVEFVENPAHKRSHLVRLTQQGRDFVDEMKMREARILKSLLREVAGNDLMAAADALRSVRELLEGEKWMRLVADQS